MDSSPINVTTSPLLIDAPLNEQLGANPVSQAIGALGEPESPSELAQRLAVVIAMLWPQIADADLFLPEKGRPLRGVRDARAGAGLLATLNSVWGSIAARGLMPVTPTLLPSDAAAGRGSTMSTPIFSGKSLEGFLVVQRRLDAPAFTIMDLEGLAALAEGVGGILPRVRNQGPAAGGSWLEQDLAAAGVIQRTYLPEPIGENSAGVRVVTEYMPAYAVGGDFYDFVDLGNGRVMGVIGDVSGKGVTAALTMGRVSADIRRLATEVSGPAELLERLNHTLSARMQDDRFVTALCVLLDAPNKKWIFANAGHVLPLLRRSTGVVSRVAYSSGPPLGIVAHAQYREETISVAAKDILLLATDGVFEILSAPRRPCSTMGQCQFTELVGSAPHDVAEISRRIVATAEEADGGGRDDLALLGIQIAG
ncbi:MAG TPA: PP2C family protein-serine/threonine phosphatase [Polyangia bacterium]|nr:PP2C family protein-serine/threonine phosphatase [Polyangia bacterium]